VPGGKAVAVDGHLASPYPSLSLGFGGGISGQVVTIAVKAGDVVEAGDLLATMDDGDLQRAIDDAQRTLERATADRDRAQKQWERDVTDAEKALADAERALSIARLGYSDTALEEARINLKWAQKSEADRKWEYEQVQVQWPPIPVDSYRDSWHRAIDERALAEKRLADAENAHRADYLELEKLQADVTQAEQALDALQAGIELTYERAIEDAERELTQAQEDLAYAQLTAPSAGIVLSVNIAPQATISAGTAVVTLVNTEDGLRFVTQNLSEQHIADVFPGQRAIVTLRTFPEIPLEGTVEAIVPQTEQAADTGARYTVYVQLAPTDLYLLPGLTGRVEIIAGE
jgi:membrane fusion protein (multidrug efflux system)